MLVKINKEICNKSTLKYKHHQKEKQQKNSKKILNIINIKGEGIQ